MDKIYTKRHLLKALKKAGLPHTYQALIKYERDGIIPQPTRVASDNGGLQIRLYSQKDIEDIVARLAEYKKIK